MTVNGKVITLTELINKLKTEHELSHDEFLMLLSDSCDITDEYLFSSAREVREQIYGRDVYIRGLIEVSNYCKNDCYYCGIRRSNGCAERYRLSREQILDCCAVGYSLGFRTFVIQGGEDGYYSDSAICDIVSSIKKDYPDCAVTLSLGERSFESYKMLYEAGADRYLLRHETADKEHYEKLHPNSIAFESRMRCLYDLKSIGYQTGCGFMVGSPFQTYENIVSDLMFINEFQPQMVGIGPFIPHKDTPFGSEKAGSFKMTLKLLAIVRLMLPNVLLPSTTALGTIHPEGREMGILAGANVVMPNLSPKDVRKKYLLYNDKISTGDEAAESIANLRRSMEKIGYNITVSRGDFIQKFY